MTEANTDILLDALNAGTLDIVLENYDLPEDMYDKHYLFTENLVLVVPKQLLSGDMLTEYQLDVSQTGRPVNWDDVPCVPLSRFSQLPFWRCVRATTPARALTGCVHGITCIRTSGWSWIS